jgi:hypothetical protein
MQVRPLVPALGVLAVLTLAPSAQAAQEACESENGYRFVCGTTLSAKGTSRSAVGYEIPPGCDKVRDLYATADGPRVSAFKARSVPKVGTSLLSDDGEVSDSEGDVIRTAYLRVRVKFNRRTLEFHNRSRFGVIVEFTMRCR